MLAECLEDRQLLSASFGFAFLSNADVRSVAASGSDVVVAGAFTGQVDFDPGSGTTTLDGGTTGAGFVAKYSSSGSLAWVKQMPTAVDAIAVGASGGIDTVGTFTGTADFGPSPADSTLTAPAGQTGGYLVRLSAGGTFAGGTTLAAEDPRIGPQGVAVGSGGEVYVAADSSGTGVVLQEFSSSLVSAWTEAAPGDSETAPRVAADLAAGGVVLGGEFSGTVGGGGSGLTALHSATDRAFLSFDPDKVPYEPVDQQGSDVFVYHVSASGAQASAASFNIGFDAYLRGLAAAPGGDAYIATSASYFGTSDDGVSIFWEQSSENYDVSRVRGDGTFAWEQTVGGVFNLAQEGEQVQGPFFGAKGPISIATDGAGNVYAAAGSPFGAGTVEKIFPEGAVDWSAPLKGDEGLTVSAVAVASDGGIYFTGQLGVAYRGSGIDFDPGPGTAELDSDGQDYLARLAGQPDTQTVVSITPSDSQAAEPNDNGAITFTRHGSDISQPLSVKYDVSGTATNGVDYQQKFGEAIIPAGRASVTIPIVVIDDTTPEGTETATFTVRADPAYQIATGSASQATVQIADDDTPRPPPPSVEVFGLDPATEERSASSRFTFYRQGGDLGKDLVVHFTVGGTATPGEDYTPLEQPVFIPAGWQEVSVGVDVIDDKAPEPPETITVTIQSDPAYQLGDTFNAALVIDDNDGGTSGGAGAALTGTPYGTAGSWNNDGNTLEKAFDGNLSTFFDAPTADGDFVALDLGTPQIIGGVKYAPRAGFESRMLGGEFQGSNSPDGGWQTLLRVSARPRAGVLTTGEVPNFDEAFRYVRYAGPNGSYGNVAEVEFDGIANAAPPPPSNGELSGTAFGTAGSWNNDGNTFAKALDGNPSTFFDAPTPDGNFVGLDFGPPQTVGSVAYAPRAGFEQRMVGGKFQGSDSANGPWTDLFTVTARPQAGVLTRGAVSNTTAFRFVRYLGPGGSYGNVAEFEFLPPGTSSPPPPPPPSVFTVSAVAFGASAAEPSTPGTIRFTRGGGSTDTDLIVHYAVNGSATNGVDYQKLSGVVAIKAGQTFADVLIQPIDDTLKEGTEDVWLTVLSSSAYKVDPGASSGHQFITDND